MTRFVLGHFGSKLDTTTDDTTFLGTAEGLQVGSGISLADVRSEWASVLRGLVVWEHAVEAEVIIARRICAESRIVLRWRHINGGSCVTLLVDRCQYLRRNLETTYRSSTVRLDERQQDQAINAEWPALRTC